MTKDENTFIIVQWKMGIECRILGIRQFFAGLEKAGKSRVFPRKNTRFLQQNKRKLSLRSQGKDGSVGSLCAYLGEKLRPWKQKNRLLLCKGEEAI